MTGGADGHDAGRIDLDRPWRQVSWVVVDVEGNGQRPPDLVEAACLPVDAGAPGSARTWLVRPPRPITEPVRRIHGIGNADVAAAPAISIVAGEIRAALAGRVVIGHHVHVDLAVLGRELDGWVPPAHVDTLRLAKAVWPGLPSYGLDNLARAAQLPPPATAGTRHRAGYDAELTAALFITLAGTAGPDVTAAQLLALSSTPDTADDRTRLF
jgi:exodeoxyribonuclease X